MSVRSKLRKSVLGSSPDEGDFCCSETKKDRMMAPTTNLFVSARRLQKQRPQNGIYVLGSNRVENDFCSSETEHDRGMVGRPTLFRRGDYRNKCHNPEKSVPDSNSDDHNFSVWY